ncbi:hypothetical protein NW768_001678 [Fusarium equiseti]|uniref:Uncharacterized protein n=1 Tax=Fusarium equiseti TaxID=61235 RepID=A0ABQ8RR79_FUSEQ|nr:hypothetical protein NW768_001678 [Fusarium equiseti]
MVYKRDTGTNAFKASEGPPPSDQPNCQDASFNNTQTKVETTEQNPGELQVRPRGVPEQRQQQKGSTIQPADSNGEEKKLPDLKIEDLPLRSNEHQASMPSRIRLKLLHLLKTGQFRHNDQSIRSPLKHQLSLQMYDEVAGEPKWTNATYERWFILVGIYGFATLRNKASGLWQAIIMRYGERLDTELAFKKSQDETGSLLRPFLSQLGEEVSMWTPTIQQHEHMLRQHEKNHTNTVHYDPTASRGEFQPAEADQSTEGNCGGSVPYTSSGEHGRQGQ